MKNQTEKTTNPPGIILASQSPRRRYLLEQAGVSFMVMPADIDESGIPEGPVKEYVRTLSSAKAERISARYPESWIIGADTIVWIDDTILGKPADRSEARKMLRRLSGRTHQVYTGFTICNRSLAKTHSETIVTDVNFKKLSDREIEWYINTDEPFDKAGAYAIQGLGTFLVKSVKGSYTNVVGLPVCEVIEYLIENGILKDRLPDKREE